MAAKIESGGAVGKPKAGFMSGSEEVDPLDHFLFPGSIEIVGDILAPLYTDEEWEEFLEASCRQLEGKGN